MDDRCTAAQSSGCGEYRVEHPRWKTYPLRSYEVDVDFKGLYGSNFAFLNGKQESSVLLAEGSDVTFHSGFRLP